MKNHGKVERMIYQIDETRDKILDTAEKMLIDKGLFATTMSDIAKAVGISRTSLYRYYRDKLDLSLAILVIRLKDISSYEVYRDEAETRGQGNFFDRLTYYLSKRWLDPAHEDSYRFYAEFDAYYSGSRIPEGFRGKMEEAMKPFHDYVLEQYIEEGQKKGLLRGDMSVPLLHEILINGLRSLHQRLILRGNILVEFPEEENFDEVMIEFLKILIDGIRIR